MELEVGDIVLCTVERIEKTVVFVNIEGNGLGSIITSEIAPGRIRNLRDYVVPKKKIVCKILRISGDHIDLSLRRVTQKEQKEVMDHHKQEKSYASILKSVLGDKVKKTIKDIKKQDTLYDFIEEAKTSPSKIEKLLGKDNAKKVLEIIKTQKKKKATIKKQFTLNTIQPNGLTLIKKLLGNVKDAEINYISAGKYTIKTESEDLKKADNKLQEILKDLEEKAKKQEISFSIKEK